MNFNEFAMMGLLFRKCVLVLLIYDWSWWWGVGWSRYDYLTLLLESRAKSSGSSDVSFLTAKTTVLSSSWFRRLQALRASWLSCLSRHTTPVFALVWSSYWERPPLVPARPRPPLHGSRPHWQAQHREAYRRQSSGEDRGQEESLYGFLRCDFYWLYVFI